MQKALSCFVLIHAHVLHIGCVTYWLYHVNSCGLPHIYTLSSQASGVYIKQTTQAHGITIFPKFLHHFCNTSHYLEFIICDWASKNGPSGHIIFFKFTAS